MPQATVAISCESVRTTIRERPSCRTSREKAASSGHLSSAVGAGVPGFREGFADGRAYTRANESKRSGGAVANCEYRSDTGND
jgi:hypothetical protein